jgi:hypothetical protein
MCVGYLGSSLIGALLIFFGFNSLASKVAAALIAALLVLVLIWSKNWFARGITIVFIVIIVLLYFVPGGWAVRYFVLFVGSVFPPQCVFNNGFCQTDLVLGNQRTAFRTSVQTTISEEICFSMKEEYCSPPSPKKK